MAVVRWIFFDATTSTTYTFAVNPNAGGSPKYAKNVQSQSTCAPDGKAILFEGRDPVQTFEFSGILLSQAEYDAFVTWFTKRHQIRITDDLGRQFWIYVTSFEPTRVRARSHAWKHTYKCTALVLDWP